MATILHETPFSHLNNGSTTNFNVTIPAAAAGAKLVAVLNSNAVCTVRTGGSGGPTFVKRPVTLGNYEIGCFDIVAVGGETVVNITMSGAGTTSGVVFESMHFGAFTSSSTRNTAYAVGVDRLVEANALTPAPTGPAVMFSAFTLLSPGADPGGKFYGLDPVGRVAQVINQQPGTGDKFWSMVGISDINSTTASGWGSAAGTVKPVTNTLTGNATWIGAWTYADTSGIPTVTWPNAIVKENSRSGAYSSTWAIPTATISGTISGYTDKISYGPGDTINLKVDSGNTAFTATLWRAGFYGDERFGARKIASIAVTPAVQPAPTVDPVGGHTTCAWTTNGSFTLPADACSGYYFILLNRTSNNHFFNVPFIVHPATKPQAGQAAIIAPVETWACYNGWGAVTDSTSLTGRCVYDGNSDNNIAHRCFGISFDKPMACQVYKPETAWTSGEHALAQFLEAQGYDVVYATGLELDDASYLTQAKLVVLTGHHEYVTLGLRQGLANALAAGVNFFYNSANTFLWRIRWHDINKRLAWCYKDSADTVGFDGTTKYDPVSYTGTWRDSRKNAGGVNNPARLPENKDTGLWFIGNGPIVNFLTVPDTFKSLPIWRNCPGVTGLGAGAIYTSSIVVVGFEYDYIKPGDPDNPTNMVTLSDTPIPLPAKAAHPDGYPYNLTDNSAVHNLVMWGHDSGAMVFNAGTWWWSNAISRMRGMYAAAQGIDFNIQQATINVMRDLGMGAPATPNVMRLGEDTAFANPGAVQDRAAYGLTPASGGSGVVAQSGFFAVPV